MRTTSELPLLLNNLKKKFSEKVQGPIMVGEFQREYQLTSKKQYLHQLAKFLVIRGVQKLVAINAWKEDTSIKLAYHFIAKIGMRGLDSKITIIISVDTSNPSLKSIQDLFPNANLFEKELSNKLKLKFES